MGCKNILPVWQDWHGLWLPAAPTYYNGAIRTEHKKQLGLRAAVVWHLSQRITNSNHKLYIDRFFHNTQCFEGTGGEENSCCWDSKCLPFCEVSTQVWQRHVKKGVKNLWLSCKLWWEGPQINPHGFQFCWCWQCGWGATVKQARYMKVSRPEVVRMYSEAMGGVDLLDQLISLYKIEIQLKKWILKMITHAFVLAVVNSWSEYRLDADRAKIPKKGHLGSPPF